MRAGSASPRHGRGLGPLAQLGLVRGIRPEQGSEGADEASEAGHLRAAGPQLAEQRLLAVAERVRPCEREPGDALG
jgi:hypothetical protein